MNYISLINQFWDAREINVITSTDADLYFTLLHKCNRIGWINPFPFTNRQIGAFLNMSEKTLIASRNRLKQTGLIDFKSGKRDRTPTMYSINYCNFFSSPGSSSGGSLGSSTGGSSGKNTPDHIRLKTKTKTKTISPLSPDGEKPKDDLTLALPHPSDEFRNLWLDLIQMPKWKNKPEKSCALALKKLSNYDEKFACQLVSLAIEGNYQGVVFPDTDERYQRWKNREKGSFNSKNKVTQPTEWREF